MEKEKDVLQILSSLASIYFYKFVINSSVIMVKLSQYRDEGRIGREKRSLARSKVKLSRPKEEREKAKVFAHAHEAYQSRD